MDNFFISDISEEEIKKERQKARELRKKQWWNTLISKGECYYCGKKVPPKELTMDHIVPLIRGGKSTKGNIVAACKDCNNKKKYMLPIEWEEYLNRIKKES
ncbi:MAG: HNH endonuclease [Calditerrivibrio sp.]|nr:HNH endonuclease [Calditerrivibrio sp.]